MKPLAVTFILGGLAMLAVAIYALRAYLRERAATKRGDLFAADDVLSLDSNQEDFPCGC